ncbi:MAG: hypothetical protein HRT44_00725 [Bdellovibrionales bacterium]|nr:hypothetical protein [Bdellovibrionales bacterium]NQZ17775.1 hypothetical protein [Bdellovibrionales bacterium]
MGRIKSILLFSGLLNLAACADVGFDSLASHHTAEVTSELSNSEVIEQEQVSGQTQIDYNNTNTQEEFVARTLEIPTQLDQGFEDDEDEKDDEIVIIENEDREDEDDAAEDNKGEVVKKKAPAKKKEVLVDTVPHMVSMPINRYCKASHSFSSGEIQRQSTVNRATHVTMRITDGRFGDILCSTTVNYQQDIANGGRLNVQIPACGKLMTGTQYEMIFHDENNTQNVVRDPRQTSLGYVELHLKDDGKFYVSSRELKILFGSNPHYLYKYGETNGLTKNMVQADFDLVESCDSFWGPNPLTYDYDE